MYCDVLFYSKMLDDKKLDDVRNQLIAASFTAWQSGAGNGKTWEKYLDALGLSTKEEKIDKKTKKRIAKKSLETAERIINMFNRNKK